MLRAIYEWMFYDRGSKPLSTEEMSILKALYPEELRLGYEKEPSEIATKHTDDVFHLLDHISVDAFVKALSSLSNRGFVKIIKYAGPAYDYSMIKIKKRGRNHLSDDAVEDAKMGFYR